MQENVFGATMSTTTLAPPVETLADVMHRLGDIPLDRILMTPPPGSATPRDLLRLLEGEPKRLCELVEGVLVEKAMGNEESRLAMRLGYLLFAYLDEHDVGTVSGGDGPIAFGEGLIRLPDVSFIPYWAIPEGADPRTPMPDWIPALAVEILSKGNTRREIERKRREYFAAGTQLVWVVEPRKRCVEVYTSPDEHVTLSDGDTLDGGAVLPGFALDVTQWFDRALKVKGES
jgi:Uma2 family endonuclease